MTSVARAPSPQPSRPPSLSQTIEVETPELVVVSYTVAGLGSRVGAALLDLVVILLCSLALDALAGMFLYSIDETAIMHSAAAAWGLALFIFTQFAIFWGYYVVLEGAYDGQTLGKRYFKLRVVRDGGYSIDFGASAVRNLMRIVDCQPFGLYAIGMVSVALSRSGKRWGDMVAGTIVVRERLVREPVRPIAATATDDTTSRALSTVLDDDEFRILERWIERRNDLASQQRAALMAQVATRLRHALTEELGPSDAARLVRLFDAEREARAQGISARRQLGAGRERYSIVATRSPRWIAFAATLSTVQRRGLKAIGEAGVRDFVAEYRALAVDLARLRTAARGEATDELFYLGRLVAAAHNVIYRRRRFDLFDVVRFMWLDVPREIRRSAAPIGLAAAMMFGPGIVAYVAVVRNPAVATTFIPVAMQERANEAGRRAQEGTGYIEDPEVFRPMMSSGIITHNVSVTFGAFAGGVTFGVLTTVLLFFNGVSLGAFLGLYASKGLLGLILAFVAPHGVLELSAICVAGGGGLLIAAALLIPGARTRRRALAENSKRAMRLLAGSTLMLVAAGSLEGMVSPIPWWPLECKLAVSGLTAVLLYLYLRSGTARATPVPLLPGTD